MSRSTNNTFAFLAFWLAVAMIWEFGNNQSTAGSAPLRKVSLDVVVTLDVFSGRPNPSWTLSVNEEAELARRLQTLPPSFQSPAGSDLGYRGFLLVNDSKRPDFPSEVVV